jgi:hypothetical protein
MFTITSSSLIVTSPSWPQSPPHVAVVGVGVGVLIAVCVTATVGVSDGVGVAVAEAVGVGDSVAVCGGVMSGEVPDAVGLAD